MEDFPHNQRVTYINEDFNKINKWFKINRLSLNATKTRLMRFYKRKKPLKCGVIMNNTTIVESSIFNIIGIIFNNNLTWIDHTNNLKLKLEKIVGILRRLKGIFPSDILKNI